MSEFPSILNFKEPVQNAIDKYLLIQVLMQKNKRPPRKALYESKNPVLFYVISTIYEIRVVLTGYRERVG